MDFPKKLQDLIETIKTHYNSELIISSGFRSLEHNKRVGGARLSQHLECKAVDFQVKGVDKFTLTKYVKSLDGVGGVGSYCGSNYIHMDIGPKRSWHWGCKRRRKAVLKKYKKHLKRHRLKNRRVKRQSKRKARYKRIRKARKRPTSKKWHYNF